MQCNAKNGFFVLTDCKKSAHKTCESCNRAMCDQHIDTVDSKLLCHECFGKQYSKSLLSELDSDEHKLNEEQWLSAYRHQYFSIQKSQPLYFGAYTDHYYDQYDIRAFDQELLQLMDIAEEDAPHLLDS